MNQAQFYTVPSETTVGKVYTVRKLATGEIRCSCPAFVFRNKCKHIKKIKN